MRFSSAVAYGLGVAIVLGVLNVVLWQATPVWAVCIAVFFGTLSGMAVIRPQTGLVIGLLLLWLAVVPGTIAFFHEHYAHPGRTIMAWLILGLHLLPVLGPYAVRVIRLRQHAYS